MRTFSVQISFYWHLYERIQANEKFFERDSRPEVRQNGHKTLPVDSKAQQVHFCEKPRIDVFVCALYHSAIWSLSLCKKYFAHVYCFLQISRNRHIVIWDVENCEVVHSLVNEDSSSKWYVRKMGYDMFLYHGQLRLIPTFVRAVWPWSALVQFNVHGRPWLEILASYPGHFALSELPEEAWNRARLRIFC